MAGGGWAYGQQKSRFAWVQLGRRRFAKLCFSISIKWDWGFPQGSGWDWHVSVQNLAWTITETIVVILLIAFHKGCYFDYSPKFAHSNSNNFAEMFLCTCWLCFNFFFFNNQGYLWHIDFLDGYMAGCTDWWMDGWPVVVICFFGLFDPHCCLRESWLLKDANATYPWFTVPIMVHPLWSLTKAYFRA